jgi:hypothetical protein
VFIFVHFTYSLFVLTLACCCANFTSLHFTSLHFTVQLIAAVVNMISSLHCGCDDLAEAEEFIAAALKASTKNKAAKGTTGILTTNCVEIPLFDTLHSIELFLRIAMTFIISFCLFVMQANRVRLRSAVHLVKHALTTQRKKVITTTTTTMRSVHQTPLLRPCHTDSAVQLYLLLLLL